MEFIFMLTRADRTVQHCLAVLDEVAPLGLRHIGFKDVGVDQAVLRALHAGIKALGATSYLEVVTNSREEAAASARMAVELGVDRLLGGTLVAETLAILRGTGVEYYPFVGRPFGHPTQLGGDADMVAAQAAACMDMGCAGVDLLAYRAMEAAPLDLVRAARRGLGAGRLICAGGVDGPARIAALRAAGCDAFTVGSAVFDGVFSARPGVAAQLRDVLGCLPE
jgi:hypothetical protein